MLLHDHKGRNDCVCRLFNDTVTDYIPRLFVDNKLIEL
jgi:hypothetical protein